MLSERRPDGGLDELIGFCVHGSSGFIQDEYSGLAQKSSSQTQQLPLSQTVIHVSRWRLVAGQLKANETEV